MSFSDLNKNHSVNGSEVLQRNYYYAFGERGRKAIRNGFSTKRNGDSIVLKGNAYRSLNISEERMRCFSGKQIDGSWDQLSNPKNAYLYNGKELHDWNGLNWQDFNMRYYMPEIGRFTGVDPIAKDYPHVTPYNYAENDPIGHIDLWGLQKARPAIPVVPKPASKTNPFAGATYKGPQASIGPAPDKSSPSFLQRVDKMLSKIPQGTSNNYKDSPNSFVGDGIETFSSEKIPGTGATPLSPGNSSALILTGEFYNPPDLGGIVGDAANNLSPFTKLINNMGYGMNVGKDAKENLSTSNTPVVSPDTLVRNEKTGSSYIYDKEELSKRGRYKENKPKPTSSEP